MRQNARARRGDERAAVAGNRRIRVRAGGEDLIDFLRIAGVGGLVERAIDCARTGRPARLAQPSACVALPVRPCGRGFRRSPPRAPARWSARRERRRRWRRPQVRVRRGRAAADRPALPTRASRDRCDLPFQAWEPPVWPTVAGRASPAVRRNPFVPRSRRPHRRKTVQPRDDNLRQATQASGWNQ